MKPIVIISFIIIATSCETNHLKYVNPLVGDADNGHCHPCATVPFGMIQVGPQSGNCSWDYTGGYQYRDTTLEGFSQNRINGTGCPDMGDLLFFPFCGEWLSENYFSSYSKDSQKVSPGYYSVYLDDCGVNAEMSATEHVSMQRYRFDERGKAKVMIDFQNAIVGSKTSFYWHVRGSEQSYDSSKSISGWTDTHVWVRRTYYYQIEFNHPYVERVELKKRDPRENAPRVILTFDLEGDDELLVKTSISLTGKEAARENIEKELPHWNLDRVRKTAQKNWESFLSRIEIKGSREQKNIFYTSMYHLFLHPNNIADAGEQPMYSTLSLWDTYRAAHPLYTIISPDYVDAFVNSMLKQYDRQGFLPIWAIWGLENHCMIGNHSVPVIADAYLKGFRGFDPEKAYRAIRTSLTTPLPKTDWRIYDKYGYFPCDLVKEESVSRTLEACIDDWSAAQMAKTLGYNEDYDYFINRAGNYRNVFDSQTQLARGRDSKGEWRIPFDSFVISHAGDVGGDYTEGNAWQYTWHVQHDVPGMIAMFGSEEKFMHKLDSLFIIEKVPENGGFALDVTGLIGQYAHGNEPSHHVAYLYAMAGNPARTQELIREICTTQYHDTIDGLCGNDDCGQMSAWYIFSVMGFYPVNPCGGDYILGAPQIPEASIRLLNGKTFKMIAEGLTEDAKYVSAVYLNNEVLSRGVITHEQIMAGGELRFKMTPTAPAAL